MPRRSAATRRKHPSKFLDWRSRQREGKIMRPSTFQQIERDAARRGYANPRAAAGKAYWAAARAKYRDARRRTRRGVRRTRRRAA